MARRRAFNAGGELISKTLVSLVNGVSQQPASLRQPSQGQVQENMISLAADGTRRRPPTEHVKLLTTDAIPTGGYKTHLRDRDENIQHVVLISDEGLRVFRLRDGVECTVQGLPLDAFIKELTGSKTDQTTEANEATADDMDLLPAATTTSAAHFGFTAPFNELDIVIGSTQGTGNYVLIWEYSKGSDTWETLSVTDGTDSFKNGNATGKVTFTKPTDWAVDTILTQEDLYWVRARYVSGTITQNPLGTQAFISGMNYLDIASGSLASEAFAITSVADFSFIVNKETTVALSGSVTAERTNDFMIHWQETAVGTANDWEQRLGAVNGNNVLNAGSGRPKDLCLNLISDVYTGPGNPEYPLWKQGVLVTPTVVYVEQEDVETDGKLAIYPPSYEWSDEVYQFIGPTTQNFSDLPVRGKADFLTEIVGVDGNEENNYWVIYTEEDASWIETVGPEQDNAFDADTMPHTLINTVAYLTGSTPDVFTFGPATWGDREKGDLDTAPSPSFVGKTLTDVVFHRNRLGLLADENVVLSESGKFFNFWPTTVTTLVDSDPIDAASTNNRVALLDFAIPFNEALYLFSGHGAVQNVLTGGDTGLTGANAQITEASAFSTSTKTPPQPSGKSLYFVVDRGVSSSIYDYTITNGIADAWDTTAHIPTYIPANVTQLSLSHKADIMTAISSDEPANIYVNSFYFDQEGVKIQNSWSKWAFHTSNTILGAAWVGEVLWITTQRDDGLHLEKLNVSTLVDGDLNYRVHLDSMEALTGVYTVADGKTRWTCASDVDPDTYGEYRAVLSDDGFAAGALGASHNLEFESGKILWAYGDFSDDVARVGRVYTHVYEFTKALITAPNDKGTAVVPVSQGRLQLGRWKLLVQDSGGFDVYVLSDEINPLEITITEEPYIYSFPSKIVGSGTVGVMNPRPVDVFQVDVGLEAQYARIRIVGNSHLPFTLVGAEWEGTYTVRASRV